MNDVERRISDILKIRVLPAMREYLSGIELEEFRDGVATIHLTGTCSGCPSAQAAINELLRTTLLAEVAEVKEVVLDAPEGEAMYEFARKVLNKEISLG